MENMNNINSLSLNSKSYTIIPIGGTRFASTIIFKNPINVKIGDKIQSYSINNGEYKKNMMYTLENFDDDIYMLSRVYTEGLQKGKKEFSFGTIENKNYPIEIPYGKLNDWINPYKINNETKQVILPDMYFD